MTFDPTTQELWQEIRAAEEKARKHLQPTRDIMRRLTGRFYSTDNMDQAPTPENHGYAFMSNVLPMLLLNNPEVTVDAARVVGHKTIAQAMEDGLNAWVRATRYAEMVQPAAVNLLVNRGVLLHYLDESASWSRGDVTPTIRWIDPECFFVDSLADSAETDTFRGHWYWEDVNDLEQDDRVPQAVKDRLESGGGETDGGKPSGTDLGRKRVRVYSVWLREAGKLRTLVEGIEDEELYPERHYYGPDSGPYALLDAYPVPGEAWPLSPLVAVEDQVLDLDLHARAMQRSAARRKSIALVEASNPDLGDKLTNAEDGEVLPVKGITGQHVEIELGGVSETQYAHTEYIRQRLDRSSGLTATMQGALGQADTATEAKIAEEALDNRTDFLKRAMMRAVISSLNKVAWFLFHTEGVVIPVNRRDAYTGEQLEGLFFGGPVGVDDDETTWDDFDLRIRLNTMQAQAQARQNMVAYWQAFLQIAQLAPQMPWVRWMNVARDLAEAFEVGDAPDRWMIPEMLGSLGQPQQFPPSQVLGGDQTPAQAQQYGYDSRRPGDPGQGFGGGGSGGGMGMMPQSAFNGPQMGNPFGGRGPGAASGGSGGSGGGRQTGGFGRTGRATGPRPRRQGALA